jgi:hypothetical protein
MRTPTTRLRAALPLLAVTLLLSVDSTYAEPAHGRLGLLFQASSGARIGAQVCATDALCLRPSFRYEWAENDSVPALDDLDSQTEPYKTQERYLGFGIDAIWRLRPEQPLCPYVGLTAALTRSDVPYPALADGVIVVRTDSLTHTDFGALGGLQYAFSHHFAIYGEVGVLLTNYDRFDFGGRRLHTRIWGTYQSGIGVALTLR